MKVTQLFELVNLTTKETLGTETVVNEDLSNIVDIGKEIINSDNLDNYVKKLVNHIGKVVFSDRLYKVGVPSVMMDSWEYGSILEKVTIAIRAGLVHAIAEAGRGAVPAVAISIVAVGGGHIANAVNDFYEMLGLSALDGGEYVGWNCDDGIYWIDFNHRKTVLDDGLEVYIIEMVWTPDTNWCDEEDFTME